MQHRITFETAKSTITEATLKELYLDKLMSKDAIASCLNVCRPTIYKLIKLYNITRDNSKVKSIKLSQSESKHALKNNIKTKVTKEAIEKWYIEEDNSYSDAAKHFQISRSMFDRLCKEYNIKKDKSKSRYKGLATAEEKYGIKNTNNWQKAQQTRIKHYGSLEESYKQGFEKIKQTNLIKYGSEIVLNLQNHAHKIHSKPNEDFAKLLQENHIAYEREFIIGTKAYDFKINNILIEINPSVTHNSFINYFDKKNSYVGIDKNYHKQKSYLALSNNYRCIHVWDWEDKNKIINLLLSRECIFARKCVVRDTTTKEAKAFLDKYHLQNYVRCSIKLGLYFNNELVSVMTFSKARFNHKYQYELIRYCSNKNVLGGSEKLFAYFVKTYNPTSIISYCDNSKFIGTTYNKLKFKLISKGIPTCHWYNIKTKKHITDLLLRQQGFDRLFGTSYGKGTSNKELMLEAGFLPIFDCGQSVYVWEHN